ncbi:hypothetical protein DOY81_001370, partial [Sarcophaga bullata]
NLQRKQIEVYCHISFVLISSACGSCYQFQKAQMSRNMRPPPPEGGQAPMRPKINASSSLLTQDENEAVFRMLGRKCQFWESILFLINHAYLPLHFEYEKF